MLRPLELQVREVEQATGERIVLRAVRTPDPSVRGRIIARPGYLLLQYRDETAGYFWEHEIIRELLELVRQGERDTVLYDWDAVLRRLVGESREAGERPTTK